MELVKRENMRHIGMLALFVVVIGGLVFLKIFWDGGIGLFVFVKMLAILFVATLTAIAFLASYFGAFWVYNEKIAKKQE